MSADGLRTLRERVHADSDLALRLRRVEPERFVCEVLSLAAELGCDVQGAEIARSLDNARQAWIMRWIR